MVSKKTVSFENSNFPKLGIVEKSFRQELTTISTKKSEKAKKVRMLNFL
jgi:hypothetical protein